MAAKRPHQNRRDSGGKVRERFLQSDRTYGTRRVWHGVLAEGFSCGLHQIERLMRMQALKARPRRRRLPKDQGERSTIVGNALDRQFVIDALMMALWRRGKPATLMHHSDQGSQYTSEEFQLLLADHDVKCLMSRTGNFWDNAVAESFFLSLKIERVSRKTYRTRDEAKADIFDYIERFYNPKRRHSTIGYVRPIAFEEKMALA